MPFHITTVFLLLIALVSAGVGVCSATVYKYKDKTGAWHYTDAPPKLPQGSQTVAGMIERSTEPVDLEKQLTQALDPQNAIERAVCATVAIESTIGTGSGFFISADGYIITNRHVLQYTDDQETRVHSYFGALESRLRGIGERLKREHAQLKKTKERLDRTRAAIDAQRDSAVKDINRSQYLADFQSYVTWEENFKRRKKEFKQKEKELWDKKMGFTRDASVAALAQSFTVRLADNTTLRAYLVKRSQTDDLALLKVDGYRTPYLKPPDFGIPADGEPVYAIGNPVSLRNSVASGTVSGVEGGFIKTDAKIYPGNSGGPLVTSEGRVIGVATFKKITHKFEGLGFAIAIDKVLGEFAQWLPSAATGSKHR
jgi:S1-C subfamily serine protease